MPNVTVQVSLRIDPAEYQQMAAAAERAELTFPMWLIQCGRAEIERQEATR